MFIAFFLLLFAFLVIVLVNLETAQQRALSMHKQRVAKRAHRRMRINGI